MTTASSKESGGCPPFFHGSSASAISIRGVSKRYGAILAVNNLDLEVAPGEIVGFLGLNGAGKTTTIRILLDLLRPSRGKAFVFGYDCQADGIQARLLIGYLPGEMGIYSDLRGREVLDLLAGLARTTPDKRRRHELQERLDLPDGDLNRKLREYSTGMKRKLGLIQAFEGDPQLLVLDEPTEGLDPLMQGAFYELLAEARKNGRTVFMSSHVLSEVERVCDRIAVLSKGELVLFATMEETKKLAARRVRVLFTDDVRPPTELPTGHELLESTPKMWVLRVEGLLGPLMNRLSVLPVSDIEVGEARLEDVLLKYYRAGKP